MFSFFKSNNPSVVLFYVFYLALFRVCFFIAPADTSFVFEHREPLSHFLFAFLQHTSVNYLLISLILSGILCFVQALILNKIVNDNKITTRKNYLAGLLFIIFSSFFKEALLLSPASLSLTFLMLVVERIFSLFKMEKPNTAIFDVGFFVAIASLFYFPSVLFFIFAFIGLSTIRPFAYNEWLSVLVGFLSPFIVVFTIYFWRDETYLLPADFINLHNSGWLNTVAITFINWVLIALVSAITVTLLTMLPSALYSSLIQVRKFATLLAIFVVFAGISFFLQQSISLSHFILLALPLGIISTLVLVQLKNKLVSEVIHLILILLVLAGQYLPLFNLF